MCNLLVFMTILKFILKLLQMNGLNEKGMLSTQLIQINSTLLLQKYKYNACRVMSKKSKNFFSTNISDTLINVGRSVSYQCQCHFHKNEYLMHYLNCSILPIKMIRFFTHKLLLPGICALCLDPVLLPGPLTQSLCHSYAL